jgi:CheY-like chemotaxis protein
MDIHLAGTMDGIENALRIRRRYGIPIIFLTSYADEAALWRTKPPSTKRTLMVVLNRYWFGRQHRS